MAKKKTKQAKKLSTTAKILIFISAVLLLAAAGLVTYKIYTNDEYSTEKNIINNYVLDKTGIDIDKTFFGNDDNVEVTQAPSSEQQTPASETETVETEKSEKTETNKAASKSKSGSKEIQDLEIPACPKGALKITDKNTKGVLETPEKEDSHQIIKHNGFILCYREKYEQPEWVCYTLNAKKIEKNVERNDNFRPDPLVLTGSAVLNDYKGSGYDRGHLAPSADLTYSFETMDESFVLSNMSPQAGPFNRGMWKDLEHEIRTLTAHYDLLYVVTGPVLEKSEYPTVGKNEVAVPEYYYKALLGIKNNKYYMIGFILPNIECKGTIWDYAVNVDEVEKRTGLDFFHLLDDTTEKALEKDCTISEWKYQTYQELI